MATPDDTSAETVATQAAIPSQSDASAELCSICCDPIQIVAVGHCDHALTCAICTLRLRMCYKDNACPFCKAQMRKVYITAKPETGSAALKYRELTARRTDFVTNKRWPAGVWVDMHGRCDGRPLKDYLISQIQLSCRICDPSGVHEEFENFKEMREHLRTAHNGSTVCSVCYQANRFFPRELEIFDDERAFQKHVEGHPRCEYCGHRYFGKDELYNHMKKKHWLCQLCHVQGQRHVYFETVRDYRRHLQEAHFACREADCVNGLIAFTTEQQLRDHLREAHGIYPSGNGTRRQNLRPLRPDAVRSAPRVSAAAVQQRRQFAGNAMRQRGEDGFVMIDDDMPPAYQPPPPSRGPQPPAWPPNRRIRMQEEFPALPASEPAPPPAITVARRVLVRRQCPCGRMARSVMLPEGTVPEPLTCDADCERAQRQARLAEAFSIDTTTYSGSFDVNYSADLITWARSDPERARTIESQLHDKIRLQQIQRFKIDGLTRDMKKRVVELAETYGAVGRVVPNANAVEVVLTNRCRLPGKKLVQYATSLSDEEYQEIIRESLKNTLFIEDIEKSVNLRRYLVTWDGDYEMEFLAKNVAKLKFRTPQAFKSACNGLGGGVRNAFRVRYPLKDTSESATTEAGDDSSGGLSHTLSHSNPNLGSSKHDKGRPSDLKEPASVERLTLGNSFDVLSRL